MHAMMSANVQNWYFEFWVIRKCVCNEGKCLMAYVESLVLVMGL